VRPPPGGLAQMTVVAAVAAIALQIYLVVALLLPEAF
jgi:K+-transporting ATPase KdpF subunit